MNALVDDKLIVLGTDQPYGKLFDLACCFSVARKQKRNKDVIDLRAFAIEVEARRESIVERYSGQS